MLDRTEPQSFIGSMVSDAEQGKTAGDIISKKDPIEVAVETGSAAAGPEKSPTSEPLVAADAGSPALPNAAQPAVFVGSDSLATPAGTGVLADDTEMSTGGDDEATESDSLGEENDDSSVATGLGKNS